MYRWSPYRRETHVADLEVQNIFTLSIVWQAEGLGKKNKSLFEIHIVTVIDTLQIMLCQHVEYVGSLMNKALQTSPTSTIRLDIPYSC